MAVSGIGSYSQSYVSSNNGFNKNTNSVEEAKESVISKQLEVSGSGADNLGRSTDESMDEALINKAPRRSAPSDFTFDFKKNNNYNLVAATSSAEDIDINKAIKDMEKDSVLEQYKFFVNQANLGTDQDGTVRIVQR